MKSSYGDIARSSGIIGGVQIMKIIFGLIQNKVLALVVGPHGFGIWGMYNTYIEMVTSFSSLGLDASGVRQIAKNPDDTVSTAKCIWVFKRALFCISLVASVLSMIFSRAISQSLFGTPDYYWGVAIVSIVILLNGIAKGNIAILNGLRHIKKLAVSQILGAFTGAVAAILSVLFLGVEGIPLFLVVIGLTAALSTWWYVRKLSLQTIVPSRTEAKRELKGLIVMGLGFSLSGAIFTFTAYLSRIFLSSEFDMSAVGIYQASWTISNLYIGTILTAMGVDFMPRLMKVIGDRVQVNQMVTEQLEFGVLLSGIGVLGILIFSPLVLKIFYSSEFMAGAPIIRWQVLGVALRIFGFVFGYAIMAHNRPMLYVFAQGVVFFLDYVLLVVFAKTIGFDGLGINYCLSYLSYLLIGYLACRRLFKFTLSRRLLLITGVEWIAIITVWVITWLIGGVWGIVWGAVCLVVYLFWINYALKRYMNFNLVGYITTRKKR